MSLDEDFDYKVTGTFYAVIVPKQYTPNNQEIEAGSYSKEVALEILKKQKSDFWYGKIGDLFFIILFSVIFLPLGIALFAYWYFKGEFKAPYFEVQNNVTRPIYEHELLDAKKWGLSIEKIIHNENILKDEFNDIKKAIVEPANNNNFNERNIQPSSIEDFINEFNQWYQYLKDEKIIQNTVSNEFIAFQDMMYETFNEDGMITYLYTQAFEKGYFLAEYIIHYNRYIENHSVDKITGEVFESSVNEVLILEDKGIDILSFLDNSIHDFVQGDRGSYERVIEEIQRDEIWKFSKEQMYLGIITRFTEFKFSLSDSKIELNGIKAFQRRYPNFALNKISNYLSIFDYKILSQTYRIQDEIRENKEQREQEERFEDLKALRDYLKEEDLTLDELSQQLNGIQDSIQNSIDKNK